MTRNGKIARLPRSIRNDLNRRLQDGEPGVRLVEWLNGLPEVRQVLERDFAGRPVNEQNVSEWKQGGYQDWLRHQETIAVARSLAEEAAELQEETKFQSVSDHLSASLAVALAQCARLISGEIEKNSAQRSELLAVAKEIAALRRGDHEQERVRIERERWATEQEKQESKKKSNAVLAPFWDLLIARQFGDLFKDDIQKAGGQFPPDLQAFLKRIGAPGAPIANGSFPKIDWPAIPAPNQTESK